MILWMIYEGELSAYFRSGRIVPRAPLYMFFYREFDQMPPRDEWPELLREKLGEVRAEEILLLSETDFIEEEATEWSIDNQAEEVGAGYFVHASELDWERGDLEAEIDERTLRDKHLFWDSNDHFNSDFENGSYRVSLKGLCFDRDKIEMLQPNIELDAAKREVDVRARPGRPRVWDWDAVTMHLVKLAQHPDGLPTGAGAQAKLERSISDWFAETTGSTPSASQVRQHAARVMRELEKPESL